MNLAISLADNHTGKMNERKSLSIEADYYSLVYVCFMKHHRVKFNLTSEEKS